MAAFPVDHGRIDLAGALTRAYLPVLRAGAMINYVVAGDEAFQERSECWLDADLRRELPDDVRATLDTALDAIRPLAATGRAGFHLCGAHRPRPRRECCA